ncbi:MAG: YggS family pyridoxal phosphate-dependent enzyme [Oscillospiraceae bacterium]
MINDIRENYKRIYFNVEEAKAKYRKSDDNVEIMAVTKTIPPEDVNVAIDCGIRLLGENKVQEFLSKKEFYDKKADVNFIGHLQTNKVKNIIDDVTLIQSVDSFKLAQEIDKQAKRVNKIQNILLEVNVGNEETKSGILFENAEDLAFQVAELKNIKLKGLMTIPPKIDTENFFNKIYELFIDICAKNIHNINMSVLSMGMSSDYELAIKYGSNLVRIGTMLFGARK